MGNLHKSASGYLQVPAWNVSIQPTIKNIASCLPPSITEIRVDKILLGLAASQFKVHTVGDTPLPNSLSLEAFIWTLVLPLCTELLKGAEYWNCGRRVAINIAAERSNIFFPGAEHLLRQWKRQEMLSQHLNFSFTDWRCLKNTCVTTNERVHLEIAEKMTQNWCKQNFLRSATNVEWRDQTLPGFQVHDLYISYHFTANIFQENFSKSIKPMKPCIQIYALKDHMTNVYHLI